MTTALLLKATATPTAEDVGAALRRPFLELDAKYDDLVAACKGDDEKITALRQLRDAARNCFWSGAVVAVEPNNKVIAHLYEELTKLNWRIQSQLDELEDMVRVINFLTEAVKLETSLATLAAI